MTTLFLILGLLAAGSRAQTNSSDRASSDPPSALTSERFRGLLQSFVDQGYGRVFRHLGDERDFDHGHVLLLDGRPVAILYHTQETGDAPSSPDFAYLDAEHRNWLQWLGGGPAVDARRFARARYPETASWEWFVRRQLPELQKRHTITDRMLDPGLLGGRELESEQWVFTRVDCRAAADAISVSVPGAGRVCLALSRS